uniref:Uncharacterized protein n=1 Tax=Cannabis sativa TaxID=3483 RepID=A0A803QQV1_CANSA
MDQLTKSSHPNVGQTTRPDKIHLWHSMSPDGIRYSGKFDEFWDCVEGVSALFVEPSMNRLIGSTCSVKLVNWIKEMHTHLLSSGKPQETRACTPGSLGQSVSSDGLQGIQWLLRSPLSELCQKGPTSTTGTITKPDWKPRRHRRPGLSMISYGRPFIVYAASLILKAWPAYKLTLVFLYATFGQLDMASQGLDGLLHTFFLLLDNFARLL